jgi:hypothetical protein
MQKIGEMGHNSSVVSVIELKTVTDSIATVT